VQVEEKRKGLELKSERENGPNRRGKAQRSVTLPRRGPAAGLPFLGLPHYYLDLNRVAHSGRNRPKPRPESNPVFFRRRGDRIQL
jgi:hypothetical protein